MVGKTHCPGTKDMCDVWESIIYLHQTSTDPPEDDDEQLGELGVIGPGHNEEPTNLPGTRVVITRTWLSSYSSPAATESAKTTHILLWLPHIHILTLNSIWHLKTWLTSEGDVLPFDGAWLHKTPKRGPVTRR